MRRLTSLIACLLAACAIAPAGRSAAAPAGKTAAAPAGKAAAAPAGTTAGTTASTTAAARTGAADKPAPTLDAQLFYQLLLGELRARGDDPGAGYSLMLDAARKTGDAALFQRAIEIAFSARAGDAALQAARAWRQALPQSRDALRYLLQIQIGLNRLDDSADTLRAQMQQASPAERSALLLQLPRQYARVADKKLAARAVEQALGDWLESRDAALAAAAWVTVGRMRVAAGEVPRALQAAERAAVLDRESQAPVLLALELLSPQHPAAERLVLRHLQAPTGAAPDTRSRALVRMAYARALLEAERYSEAAGQLEIVTRSQPQLAQAWLVQGTLQLQELQPDAAEQSLRRYLALTEAAAAAPAPSAPSGSAADRSADSEDASERARGRAQAFLQLARIAEQRGDFAAANGWLDRITDARDLLAAQLRRASIMARQGRVDDARKLIADVPARDASQARSKLLAEVQLLRDNQRTADAFALLAQALKDEPRDADLLYEQSLVAEKLGRFDDMERLLRELIAVRPDHQHAYNALGYSLADRNLRLDEARTLILRALELAPGDASITDSLGWVEYRMGNIKEALRLLDEAYRKRPDPEIAAHLGEVLWQLGQRDRARAVWKEGLLLNAANETLRETLKRFGVNP